MATLLQTLKVSTAQRPRQLSPTMTRRTKLLKLVAEQCDAAAAAINNERHAVHVTRTIRDAVTGEKHQVNRLKRIRHWWWTGEDGKCYLEIRYGWRRLEVGKGKTTVEVGEMANLLPVLEKIRDAVMLGELDDQLTSASLRLADQLKSKRTATAKP